MFKGKVDVHDSALVIAELKKNQQPIPLSSAAVPVPKKRKKKHRLDVFKLAGQTIFLRFR